MMITLPLADELFLVGHDQYSGKAQVDDRALDTGLVGGVLGEMVLSGRLGVDADTMIEVWDRRPYGDRVTDAALAEVLKQDHPHSARSWVEYLRDHVRTMVAARLVLRGLIQQQFSRQRRFPAVDPVLAAAPQARLRFMLDRPGTADEQTAALGALMLATGLDFVVGRGSGRRTRQELARMHSSLRPDLHQLVLGVEAASAQLQVG
jgi:Golgi phosphoprotein 3 (GPP34)